MVVCQTATFEADPQCVLHHVQMGMVQDMFKLLGCRERFKARYQAMRYAAKAEQQQAAANNGSAASGLSRRSTTVLPKRLREQLSPTTDEAILARVLFELDNRGDFEPIMHLFPMSDAGEEGTENEQVQQQGLQAQRQISTDDSSDDDDDDSQEVAQPQQQASEQESNGDTPMPTVIPAAAPIRTIPIPWSRRDRALRDYLNRGGNGDSSNSMDAMTAAAAADGAGAAV